MTEQELAKIPFRCIGSLAMEDEHCLTYISKDGRLGFCVHTKKKKNGDFGRSYRHYHIDGKVYTNKEEFLEALKEFSPKVVPIRKKL